MIPKIYACLECNGTGTLTHNLPNGGAVVSNPCPHCGATGKKVSETEWVDTTYFDEKFGDVFDKLADIKEKVDEIKASLG